MNEFPHRVRGLREKLGLTQAEFADLMGLSASYIHQLEAGKRNPSDALLKHLEAEEQKVIGSGDRMYEAALDFPPKGPAPYGRRMKAVSWEDAYMAKSFKELEQAMRPSGVASSCTDQDAFAVQLRGESMEPRYFTGDYLIVMPEGEPRRGSFVMGNLKEEGLIFRIVTNIQDGRYHLSAYNPLYPPSVHRRADFHWLYPVHSCVRIMS